MSLLQKGKRMAKTSKVMEVIIKETRYLVIKDNTCRFNPYKVFRKWYDCGWHRNKVTAYADLESVLRTLTIACQTKDGWIAFTKDGVLITH